MSLNVFFYSRLPSIVKIALAIFIVAFLSSCGKVSNGLKGNRSESEVTITVDQPTLTSTEGQTVQALTVLSDKRKQDSILAVSLTSTRDDVAQDFLGYSSNVTIAANTVAATLTLTQSTTMFMKERKPSRSDSPILIPNSK